MAGEIVPQSDLPDNVVPVEDLPASISMVKQAPSPLAPVGDWLNTAGNAVASNTGLLGGEISQHPITQYLASTAKKAALPMAGQTAGLYAGTAMGGPAGGVIGESLLGGAGEMANQMLGITEPSWKEVALAMAAGPVTRGLIGGLRTVGGSLVRSFGGRQVIADAAADVAENMLKPVSSSEFLFNQASSVAKTIPTPKTAQTIGTILKTEASRPGSVAKEITAALESYGTKFGGTSTAAITAEDFAKITPGQIENLLPEAKTANEAIARAIGKASGAGASNAQDLAIAARDLRYAASVAYKIGNSRLGNALGDVRQAMFEDAANSGVPVFKEAAKAYAKESSINELQAIIRSPQPLKAFETALDKNKLFASAVDQWTDAEKAQVKSLLVKLTTVAPSGFSGVAGRALTAVGGNIIGGKIGAALGFIAPDVVAYALSKPAGRAYMEKLLIGNVWDAPRAAALGQWVRASQAQDAQSGDTAKAIKAALQSTDISYESKIRAAQMGAGFGGASNLLGSALK